MVCPLRWCNVVSLPVLPPDTRGNFWLQRQNKLNWIWNLRIKCHTWKNKHYSKSYDTLGSVATNCQAPSSSLIHTEQLHQAITELQSGGSCLHVNGLDGCIFASFHKAITWVLHPTQKRTAQIVNYNLPKRLDCDLGKFWFGVSRIKQSRIQQTKESLFHTCWNGFVCVQFNRSEM